MSASLAANVVGSIPKSIAGECAWQGKELQTNSSWIVHWTPAQINELESAAQHFADSGLALENITPESFPLPTLKPFIHEQLNQLLNGRGFVMLRGLPIQDWSKIGRAHV